MVYEMFVETVKQRLQEDFGPDCRVEVHSVIKNNGVMLDGISMLASGRRMSPTVYLNPYYEQLCLALMNLDEICADIAALFRSCQLPSGIPLDQLDNLEQMRHRIMMKLIHTESNKTLLAGIPHISYLDLSIVFYLFLERSEAGQMTALITNDHLSCWKISRQDLLRLALDNTPVSFPARIRPMAEILKDIARQNLGSSYDEQEIDQFLSVGESASPLYVLTNESGIHGAVCMLYRNVLKNFADLLDRDLIIIPSSVHEVLLTPLEDGISFEDMNAMVVLINRNEVAPEDQLSNHVYRYERSTDKISVASCIIR